MRVPAEPGLRMPENRAVKRSPSRVARRVPRALFLRFLGPRARARDLANEFAIMCYQIFNEFLNCCYICVHSLWTILGVFVHEFYTG